VSAVSECEAVIARVVSDFIDARPLYATAVTGPVDAIPRDPATFISIPVAPYIRALLILMKWAELAAESATCPARALTRTLGDDATAPLAEARNVTPPCERIEA